MTRASYLHFGGLNAPVALLCCDELLPTINCVVAGWPFKVRTQAGTTDPCLTISTAPNQRYRVTRSGPGVTPKTLDAVNTVCEMIAELAWEQLRSDPALLCIHGAAVVFNGRLVIFPARRRAGKSTLTACLAARNRTIFTDDFLPLAIDPQGHILGVANGILPRVRLPLADGVSPELKAWVDAAPGPFNAQYKYLAIGSLATKGARLPVGAIVMLDRSQDGPAELHKIERSQAMDRMIVQNFSRSVHSGTIVKSIDALTRSAALFQISYSNAQDAADVLDAAFAKWDHPLRRIPGLGNLTGQAADLEKFNDPAQPFRPRQPYVQTTGMTEVSAGSSWYLADSSGLAVHRLNQGSIAIWRLLQEPMTLNEIAEVLCSAFPDADPAQVSADAETALRGFARARLIRAATPE